MSGDEFKSIWRNKIVFAITNRRDAAEFNANSDWTADRLAPLGMAISRQGLSRMLLQRGPNDFRTVRRSGHEQDSCECCAGGHGGVGESSAGALPSYDFGDCLRALDCRRLNATELDRMRGGFSFMSGSSELQVSIGISRAVFINDQLVAVTQDLVLPTLQQLRDGTLPSATAMGAISAASQPASQREAVPSDTAG